MEVKGGPSEEGEHHALGDGTPENEVHWVAENQEDAGEGNGKQDAADFYPADAVFGVAVMIDPKDAECIGQDAGVGGGSAEDGRVKDDDGADEKKPEAPFAESGPIHVRERFDHLTAFYFHIAGVKNGGAQKVKGDGRGRVNG